MGSKKRDRKAPSGGSTAARHTRAPWVVLGLVIVAAAALGVWFVRRSAPESAPAATAHETSATAVDAQQLGKVLGRWRRPDGGYVLEIQRLESDGTLQATYSNPNPIHISQARAFREQDATLVFIELQDTGYPGATYELMYIDSHDVLAGRYTQPAVGQTFDVYFERLR